MALTKLEIGDLDDVESLMSQFNQIYDSSESSIKEVELDLVADGLMLAHSKLARTAHVFQGTEHASRFVDTVNALTEMLYRAGHPNSMKEFANTRSMHHIFEGIKISGKDPDLERRYEHMSCLPPEQNLT